MSRRHEQEPRSGKIFGFRFSPHRVAEVVEAVTRAPRATDQGVGLIVTANIDHIVKLNGNADFRAAYDAAEIITCDGFPVYYYARLRGLAPPEMGYGFDITERLFRFGEFAPWQRLFFVADSAATVAGLRRWAESRGIPPAHTAFAVPSFGFEHDRSFCSALSRRIAEHGTTILLMGVGAPRSEIFVQQNRDLLPPCWALCVGQAIRMESGEMQRVPEFAKRAHVVWLWRLVHEPKRLFRRYFAGGLAFLYLAVLDLIQARAQGKPAAPHC
jgi:N-acetylglucosaminyldiphosphoundecaprenol N-acetyl-beta-D-mannosaminyltransferase